MIKAFINAIFDKTDRVKSLEYRIEQLEKALANQEQVFTRKLAAVDADLQNERHDRKRFGEYISKGFVRFQELINQLTNGRE